MKVLIVSFYNTEAYGVRSLHASVVRSGHDAKMLFFKMETHSYEKALKKGYIGENDLVDHISTWQDNYNISKDGWNVDRSFVNRTVSLISFLAKDGRLVSSDIQHMIENFIQNRNLEEVTARLEEFLK